MAQARKAQVIITANASVAEKVMQELEGAATRASNRMKSLADTGAQIKDKMRQLAAANKQNTDEYKQLDAQLKQNNKDFKAAEKEFQAFNSRMRENVKDTKRVEQVMKDLANTATRDLRRAFQAAKRELEKMSEKDPRRQQLIQDMKKIQQQIDTNTGAIKKQQGAWGALGTTMKNLFAYAGIFAAFNRLKGLFEDVIQKNREMSDQLANIRKVSGLAMSDINGLAKNLAKIDTRTSVQGLNDLAYVGAKLGFGNLGTEALESFVKSALKVENALKEDLGEDSMMAISKLVEVMGLIPKMGVEKAMDSAGSAIFKLASTSTATGANIIEFSKRLMGLANVSHITTDQLLALGSASDAMGLMPEVSATAFNKVFTSIQSNTRAIEQSLQMQKGELTELINEGKTMEAIVTVFDKMHGMNMDQLKAQGVFKALGSDGARLNNVMITMSDRIDMLKTHLKTSNQAFSEGSAVAQEYAIQMETAEAYYQRAANMWQKAFVNPDGVDLTKEFAQAWYDLSKALTQTEGNATAIKIIMESIFGIMKLLVELLPAIITGFATWGMWAGGAFLIKQLKELLTMLTAIGTGVRSISWAGLAGVITGVAMGTYILFQKFRELNGELQKTRPYMDGFKKDLSDLNTQFGAATQELDRYKRAIDSAASGTKQRAAAIAEFNNKFGGYLKNMLTEESSAYAVAKAYEAVTKALRAKMALQLKEKDINDQVMPREQWTAERREEYAKSVQGSRYSQYGRDWITAFAEENKGRKIGDIGKDLAKIFGISAKEVANMLPTLSQAQTQNRALYTDQQWMVRNALRYIAQDRSARNAATAVNKKWAPEQKAIDDYLASQTPKETPITPIDDTRLTKEELAAQRKAEADHKQAIRKDLQDAKQESDAIIAKIEEWYRLQETVVTGFAADGKWTQQQAEMVNRELEAAKNEALANARLAISGRDTQTWEQTKESLRVMMFDTGEWSQELFQQILDVSMSAISNKLAKIDAAGGKYGITTSSLKDGLDKNAAGNRRKVQELRNKTAKEVEKMLKQYDFLQQAMDAFDNRLAQLGLLTDSAVAAANRIRQATENPDEALKAGYQAPPTAEQVQQQRRQGLETAATRFIAGGGKSMAVNYNDSKELNDWLRELTNATVSMGANGMEFKFESWADAFKEDFDKWLHNTEKYKSEIQAFYLSLVQASDDYTEATKKAYEREKKLQDQRFQLAGYRDQEEQTDKSLERQGILKDAGIGQTIPEQLGLDKIADDPEILRIQNRIHWRKVEYDDAKRNLEAQMELDRLRIEEMQRNGATEQEIEDAKMTLKQQRSGLEELMKERETALINETYNLTSQVAQQMQKRVDSIKNFVKPVTDFTQAAGRKIGDMIFNMKSEEATWEELWKNMALAVGEAMIEMGAQYLQNLIMQQSINRASEAEEAAHVATEIPMGIAAGSAKTIGQLGWWGIPLVAVISALLMGLLQAALSTNRNNNSATAAKPKVKLASGMLTYDEGNVQTVVGDDGRVYRAREQRSLPEGVSMVTEPIATRVNGQAALVGERGPEIVIGRRTTRAIQMNRPDLLRDLAMIDRGITTRKVRTFDEGNISDMASAFAGQLPATQQSADGQQTNGQIDTATADALRQLPAAMAAFAQVMGMIQKDGIPANLNMFGDNGAYKKFQQADKFYKKYGG